ncbi:protein phosphatase 2C domain-containing protein [Brachybacterium halotolerans subsp. kimchii]|uniref:PP2C family protein-serine/threonine phosphatase n=1 Tax=Brachybacterium halotolerans TaxID=2795215 RepID=UPI001E4674B0|nr:protein phosphatase 2C domain-containing protein [Brachybacterium halotolerans]UEJ82504.1 protein phosphatase 2C domain-containing protein [Brachybacterium halotolerans subsp. kimchii]
MIDASLTDPDLPGTVRVVSAHATDVGRVRETNEDSVLDAHPIHMVADGMGGHNAGEVASAIAVEEFEKLTVQENVTIEQLGDALRSAGARISGLSADDERGAGTTVALVATMVLDGVGYWVVMNLGDSRVYRLSGELFEQVSVDHSVVQELIDHGDLTDAEARVHPYRHMITRALGVGAEPDPDFWLIPAEVGDRILVCSDGLTNEISDEAIERLLRSDADVDDLSRAFVRHAVEAGGHDNVSVVVVEATALVGLSAGDAQQRGSGAPQPAIEVEEDTHPRGADGAGSSGEDAQHETDGTDDAKDGDGTEDRSQ